jgi:hypothetical protein
MSQLKVLFISVLIFSCQTIWAQEEWAPPPQQEGPPADLANPGSASPCIISAYSGGSGCDGTMTTVSDPAAGSAAAADTSQARQAAQIKQAQLAAIIKNMTPPSPACQVASQEANMECNSSSGLGSAVAGAVNGAMAARANGANPNANCTAAEVGGVIAGAGDAYIYYACQQAVSRCNTACGTGYGNDAAYAASCANTFSSFQVKIGFELAQNVVGTVFAGRSCNGETNPNTPNIPGGPAYQGPAADEVQNKGLTPYAGANTQTPQSDPTSAGSGNAGLPGGAPYPGGAPAGAQAKNDNSGLNSPGLGLSNNGGGGGWPSGTVGGNGAAAGGAAPLDLSALLPGKVGDPSRAPASISEVTGANDLTNFQKVTRMMNKKRLALKSGEGA